MQITKCHPFTKLQPFGFDSAKDLHTEFCMITKLLSFFGIKITSFKMCILFPSSHKIVVAIAENSLELHCRF